jgi:hypothetical protein
MAEGEPVFFGIILFFAVLVLLGIAANCGLTPPDTFTRFPV